MFSRKNDASRSANNNDKDEEENPNAAAAAGTTWQLRRRKSIDTNRNRKRQRSSLSSRSNSSHVSGTQSPASSSAQSQSSSTSRSLFSSAPASALSVSTIICNTQDVSRFDRAAPSATSNNSCTTHSNGNNNSNNTNSTNHTLTPKASGRGRAPLTGRTSLFGSVMQQVGQCSASKKRDATTAPDMTSPAKRPANNNSIAANIANLTTPRQDKRRSAFTPDHSGASKKRDMPFGSPGGFQLLDFIHNFGSPFSKHSDLSNHSQRSTNSTHILGDGEVPEDWQNASLDQGIMDFSLPESIRFDCHPGRTVQALLQQQHPASTLGMMRFLQPSSVANTGAMNHGNGNSALAQWGSGLLFWQHPAVYPSPFGDKRESKKEQQKRISNSKNDQSRVQQQQLQLELQSQKSKKKRNSTLDLASSAVAAMEARNTDINTKRSSAEQQRTRFQRQRRAEWRQAFSSLHWKWISQIDELNKSSKAGQNHKLMAVYKTYFYARGGDHAVLFQAVMDSRGDVVPNISVTSSSAAFRDKLRYSGVEKLCLTKSWNGNSAGTIFSETMIKQEQSQRKIDALRKSKPLEDVPVNNNIQAADVEAEKSTPQKKAASTMAAKIGSPMKGGRGKDTTSSILLSPVKTSNSPMVEEELAALRRAQVFGHTVGADVTISIKPNKAATGPKLVLKAVPPLFVTGWDDCAAFFEVYMNLGSSCITTYKTESENETTKSDKLDEKPKKKLHSKFTKATSWQLPEDVPLLVCRGVGPFVNSTMKSLTVRGDPHSPLPREHKQEIGSPEEDQPEQDYTSLEILGGPILPCAILDCFRGLVQTMVMDKQQNSSPTKTDDDASDEDALVGSHNLVLHSFQPEYTDGDVEERYSKGIIGSSRTEYLNHCFVDQRDMSDDEGEGPRGDQVVRSGHVLGMAVWDILHAQAMAYKTDPCKDPASSSLLFPS